MVLCPSELKLGREMWTHPGRVNSQKLDFAGSLEFATSFENVLTNGSTLQSDQPRGGLNHDPLFGLSSNEKPPTNSNLANRATEVELRGLIFEKLRGAVLEKNWFRLDHHQSIWTATRDLQGTQ